MITVKFEPGDYVRIGGPSVIAGSEAVVIRQLGEKEVYAVTVANSRLVRFAVPIEHVEHYA